MVPRLGSLEADRHSLGFMVFIRGQLLGGKGETGWQRKKLPCDADQTKPQPGLECCPPACPALSQNGWALNTHPLGQGMWAGWEEHDTARLTLQELMAGGGLPASPLPSGSRSFLEGDLSVSCLPQ